MAESTHLLGLPLKHKPKDIKPQGSGSGLDADKVDGLHASEISGGGPHATSHETGGTDKVHFADLEHDETDATLHDALTSAPHISQAEKDKIHDRLHAMDSALDHTGVITDSQHGTKTTIPDAHHRKWGWADEQGQNKTFYLPLICDVASGWKKYANNPVLSPSGDPNKFDENHVQHHAVVYRNGKLYLFYVGVNSDWAEQAQVGYAASTDFKTFTRQNNGNPVIKPTDFEAGGKRLDLACVIYDTVDNKWKYWGWFQRSDNSRRIVYAENPNTEPTTGWTGHYITTRTELTGGVFRFGNMYYMFTTISNVIRCLTSYDGKTWTLQPQTLLGLGAAGNWDDAYLEYTSIFWNMGIAYLLYSGSRTDWSTCDIGMAIDSKNVPLYAYDRWWLNAGKILDKGTETGVLGPQMVMVDDMFYTYFMMWNGANLRIGLASLPKAVT